MKTTRNNISLTTAQLAEKIGARLEGDKTLLIDSAAPVETAEPNQISFIANSLYEKHLSLSKAGAVVLNNEMDSQGKTVLRHPNPYLAFAKILDLLYPDDHTGTSGIHESAIVDESAEVAKEAAIGPYSQVESDASVGESSRLMTSVYLGKNSSVGKNCLIYPRVVIMNDCKIGNNVIIHSSTVIGSDGFGYTPSETGIKKIKQVGWVEIEDDVEIGSNVSIDRGALGATKIGRGTKIDNLVQIAHNVQIGQNCFIVSQVGISGSTIIGNNVTLAGQVGVRGHISIGEGATVGGQSGVTKSIPAGDKIYFGCPAREMRSVMKKEASLSKVPDLIKRVRELEKKLKDKSGR